MENCRSAALPVRVSRLFCFFDKQKYVCSYLIFKNKKISKTHFYHKSTGFKPCAFVMKGGIMLVLGLLLFFSACQKQRTTIPLEALTTPTTATLYDITFTHPDTGYVIGGTHWQHGEWLVTTNGGDTWRTDTFANNGLLAIDFLDAETAITVGFDGQAFYKSDADTWWLPYYPPEGETMNAVDFWDENTGVVVGGKNFAFGLIYRLNNINGTADTVHYPLPHELRDVQFTNKNTVHTVGYGYVGKSTDGGLTWQASDIQGDFFYALYFVNQEVGYAVGRSGTIIKTTDGGGEWQKIRNGNNVFVRNERFRDVWFKSEEEGYIVGDEGLFWWTDDGGDSWKIVEDTPDVTFHRIYYQNGIGFIAGEEGKIYRFKT